MCRGRNFDELVVVAAEEMSILFWGPEGASRQRKVREGQNYSIHRSLPVLNWTELCMWPSWEPKQRRLVDYQTNALPLRHTRHILLVYLYANWLKLSQFLSPTYLILTLLILGSNNDSILYNDLGIGLQKIGQNMTFKDALSTAIRPSSWDKSSSQFRYF